MTMQYTAPSRTEGHRWIFRYGYFNGNAYAVSTRMCGTQMVDRYVSVFHGTTDSPSAGWKYYRQHGECGHSPQASEFAQAAS